MKKKKSSLKKKKFFEIKLTKLTNQNSKNKN